jgi:hypothetical protein
MVKLWLTKLIEQDNSNICMIKNVVLVNGSWFSDVDSGMSNHLPRFNSLGDINKRCEACARFDR